MPDKNPGNIEDLIRSITGSTSEEDKENIALYEKHMKTSNQARIQTQFVEPAFDGDPIKKVKGAYHSSAEQIDKEYGEDKVDVKDEEKLHRVITAYMIGYFEHAKPAVLKALPEHLRKPVDQLSKEEIKSLYELLANHFDSEVGAGQIQGVQSLVGLDKIIKEEFEDEDEVTADMLKNLMRQFTEGHKKGVTSTLNAHARAAYISHLPQGVYAAHVLKKTGKSIKPKNEAKFLAQDISTIAGEVHHPLIQGRLDDVKYKKHGFYDEKTK